MKNNYHHSQRKKINKYGAFFCCCLCSKNQALELTWGHGSSVFLSWSPSRTSSSQDSHQVELCRQLGERLGLKDGEQVHLHSEAFVCLTACQLLPWAEEEVFLFTHSLSRVPQGFLKSCHQVSSVHQVFVEPLTSDDWEILVGEAQWPQSCAVVNACIAYCIW